MTPEMQAKRDAGNTGEDIIRWAVNQCERQGIPPTDSAIVRCIRFYPREVSHAAE